MEVNQPNELERNYNFIYKELVDNDGDLVGMIAYSLYKSEKIKYLDTLRRENGSVNERDIKNYHIASQIRINDYEEKAIALFTDVVNDIIDKKVRLTESLIKDIVEKTASPKGFKNWARVITQNILAAIIYSIIVFVILLFVWFKNSGEETQTKEQLKEKVKTILPLKSDSIK